MSKVGTWVLFLIIGLILIDVGIQGRLGSLLGAIITPSQLLDSSTNGGRPIEPANLPGETNG